MADRLPFDELHHQEEAAVGLAEVVDPHEVLVLQLGADAGLALEPRDRPRVIDPFRSQDFQGDATVEPGVPGEVDSTHPPLAEQVHQHVAVHLETAGPPGQELLCLPESEGVGLDRLPRQATVDVLRSVPLRRRDRIPASRQTFDVHQAAEHGRLPESRRLGVEHEAS